ESAGNAENGKITENTRNAEGAAVETAETTESKTAGDGTAEKEGASANEGEMIGEAVASISGQDASVEGIASEEAGAEYLKKKTESGTADGLRAQVEAALSGKNGTWSVYYKKMSTGESFTIGDQPMVAASLIKLFVYGAVRKKIEAGQLENTYDSTLRSMITVSDNTACNTLIDAVGGFSEVNAFIQSIGCSSSQLNRKMLAAGPENYTSTRDCGFVLESALNGTYVSQETSRLLLEAMGAQTRKGKIPQGVPAGVPTANKTGELGGVENDAAIVYAPSGNYILCVMSSNGNSGEQIAAINQVSSIVYNYENK
ncbi:MAG: serine hydrolase, partial [Lachnospiraceae bacterium]|nr:serine hydrolase [Lachnospiraceae bacterium]